MGGATQSPIMALLTAGNQASFYMPSRPANAFGVGGAAASVECRFFIATPGARSSIRVQLIAVTERKRWRDVHSWKQRHHWFYFHQFSGP